MIPSFLITVREVIEASLIVATIIGILVKLNRREELRTVWYATGTATLVSIILLAAGSIFGLKMQEIYSGRTEEIIEGIFMITSAVFITYAVFFLHKYFSHKKVRLIKKINETVEQNEKRALFILVFTAVFREGFEIALFLSTIYFSSDPQSIFSGFAAGAAVGLTISYLLFTATLKMPVYYAFRITSILLILFAGGLLARGIHEFAEAGIVPEIGRLTLMFVPQKATFAGDMVKALFGLTRTMDFIQLTTYSLYVGLMFWWVFLRNKKVSAQNA